MKREKIWRLILAIAVVVAFMVLEGWMLWYKGDVTVALIPVALLVVWLFVKRLEHGLLLMALLTPFAIDVALMPKMELSMPVEPLMILFSAIFLFRLLLLRRESPSSSVLHSPLLRHPVTLLLLASLAWMGITTLTSELPMVSLKYLLARLWFVMPFFFAGALIFRNPKRIRQFYWAYAIGLATVILIATSKTLGNFSDLQTLHRVMRPFYNDHTAYGCAIALMLPAAWYFLSEKWHMKNEHQEKRGLRSSVFLFPLSAILLFLLCIGLFFSYCRAAWLSVLAVIGVYVLIRMGMKVRWMILLFGLGVGVFFVYQSDVLYKLGKNHQDSSYDLAGQVKSISNISTDASNLERLNRWASAIRMWKESPVMGCGPGTYQFLYAGYQRSYQLSTISTNAGDLGNAHSEYIGPLTEQGVPGVALVLGVFLATFTTGVRVYRTARDPKVARMSLAFTLSLLTYYVHGVFNNFLDTDKLSVPFWGFTAVVVALDLYSEKKEEIRPTPVRRKGVAKPVLTAMMLLAMAGGTASAQEPLHDSVPADTSTMAADSGAMLIEYGRQFLGTPYRFGGKTPKGFDCAGYARYLYLHFGYTIAPSSGAQYKQGVPVKSVSDMKPGDLVFFGGRGHHRTVGHTGIVVSADTANGTFTFIHASTSRGVIISRSTEAYYKKRYIGARRIFKTAAP